MPTEQQQLEVGIAALEAQRPLLGDAVVEAMLADEQTAHGSASIVQPC